MRIAPSTAIPLIFLALGGCSNAISYHHAERVGISLEAKTSEPQQPLQGTVGLRTRTVVVAPGINSADPNAKAQATSNTASGNAQSAEVGDSTSVISDFSLNRSESGVWGSTRIRSAFITGEAAIKAPVGSAVALAGFGARPISDLAVYEAGTHRAIYEQLKAMADEGVEEAAGHVAALDALSSMLPDITNNKYYVLSGNDLQDSQLQLAQNNFQDVLTYEKALRSTQSSIQAWEKIPGATLNGHPTSRNDLVAIDHDKKQVEAERLEFAKRIGSSAVIDSAANYLVSTL